MLLARGLYKFFFFLNLFIYYWLCWDFTAAWAFSTCGKQGLLSSCSAQASHCSGFLLQIKGSRVFGLSSCGSQVLKHRLNGYGEQAWLLCRMWGPPRPGITPMSPASAGGEPPGKPSYCFFFFFFNLFIFDCAGFSLLSGLLSSSGGHSSYGVWVFHCDGFSSCRARALGREGFNSCGAWA